MHKILITGSSGFIGTNLIESFLKEDVEILAIDKSTPHISDHISFWKKVDILDYEVLKNTLASFQPNIIIHLAAVTDLNGSTSEYYSANTKGLQNLINAVKEINSVSKIIFTSSMYVCKPGFIPPDYNTYKPHTEYGQSKVEGELIVKTMKDVNFEWCIIRPTSIWGPWFNIPYIDFFKIVYQGRYFDFGKACTKSYGFVDNTVYQIKKLIESEVSNRKTYYLGDLPPTQISEWANEISISMGKGKIKSIPYIVLSLVAKFGDLLKLVKINFPITSFRLSNMTTDNVLPLNDIYVVAGPMPVSRKEGTIKTLKWLRDFKQYNIIIQD